MRSWSGRGPVPSLAVVGLVLAGGCHSGRLAGSGGPTASAPDSRIAQSAVLSHGASPSRSAPVSSTAAASSTPACGAASSHAAGIDNGPLLRGVQFVSATTGWAVGTDRIVATADGERWAIQYRTQAPGFNSVDFIDAKHGWALGPGVVVATDDGGRHWRQLSEPCPVLRSVHFISSSRGFAVAGENQSALGGVLLDTIDGGRTWRNMRAPVDVQSVCFDGGGRGWLGAHGHIFGTVDAGRSWQLAVAGYGWNPQEPPQVNLQCAGGGAAWAVSAGPGGAGSQQPHVGLHTSGTTWSPIFAEQYFPYDGTLTMLASAPGSYAGPFSAVSGTTAVFIDSCASCEAGSNSPVAVTADSGAHLLSRGDVWAMTWPQGASFVSASRGWVVGDHVDYRADGNSTSTSEILHTDDEGRSWTLQYSLPSR